MIQTIGETIEDLSNYIQEVIKSGSSEELQLLPELVNALANLVKSY